MRTIGWIMGVFVFLVVSPFCIAAQESHVHQLESPEMLAEQLAEAFKSGENWFLEDINFVLACYWTRYALEPANEDAFSRFLGLLEFALQGECPDGVVEALQQKILPNHGLGLSTWHQAQKNDEESLKEAGYLCDIGQLEESRRVTNDAGKSAIVLPFKDGNFEAVVLKKNIENVASLEGFASLWVFPLSEGRFLAAKPDSSGIEIGYKIFLFDSDGEKKWDQIVWCGTPISHLRNGWGKMNHRLRIKEYQNRLILFGILDFSVYIEVFDKTNGKPVVRFSTSYAKNVLKNRERHR